MFTYDATIGRNVGTEPMSDLAWHVFQGDVLDAFVTTARRHQDSDDPDVWAVESFSCKQGSWNGTPEESARFHLRTAEPLSEENLEHLKFWLRVKAAEFKQDAIAFSIGSCELLASASGASNSITFD